jgi:hypothetical protein
MKSISTFLALSLSFAVVAGACGKDKDKDKGGGDKAESSESSGGPVKTSPQALFADFAPDSKLKGMDLLDKYHDGATFTGNVIAKLGGEGKDTPYVDAGNNNKISLEYQDAAKSKAVKIGDSVTVTCKIGGESGHLMMALDCR